MRSSIFATAALTVLTTIITLNAAPNTLIPQVSISEDWFALNAYAADTPIPLVPEDWNVTNDGAIERWSSTRPDLAGAALFKRPEATTDVRAALTASMTAEGYEAIEIIGAHPVENIRVLDSQGSGTAFTGTVQQNGEPVRFAAVVLYGTTDGSPRVSTVYAFTAPQSIARRMGGWVPVAAAWLGLRANEVPHLLIEQGESAPAAQAETLAAITDYFFADLATAMGLYQQNLMNTTNQFMMDYMCTGVVGVEDVYFGSSDC